MNIWITIAVVLYCFACWIGFYVWFNYDPYICEREDIWRATEHECRDKKGEFPTILTAPLHAPFLLIFWIVYTIVVWGGEFIIDRLNMRQK